MYRFTTPEPPRLSLELRSGSITVDTADVDETTVELAPLNDSKLTQEAIDAAVVEQRGQEIVAHVPLRFGGFPGRSPQIAMRVTAPHEAPLRAKTGSAAVMASGRYGTTRIDTGSGDVEVGDVVDSARIKSGSGDIRIQHVSGELVVTTGSGDIAIGSVDGEVSIGSGSGDVSVEEAATALGVKTGSGDVTVGRGPSDVRVVTGSGKVRIDAVDEGEVQVKAASGNVRVGVRDGTAAWLDVRSVSGRVTSELAAAGEPGPDERQVRLRLSTASGNIDLARV